MKNLSLSIKAITTGFCLTTTAISGCHAQQQDKPNIIIILTDDQGWGDVGYYDHPVLKTPNLDDMSRSGIRFDRFYAAAPVCSPTRGSVMTGRHPNRYEIFTWGNFLRPQEITLAEVLKASGYVTGHFGKWHLGPVYNGSPIDPTNSGFDEWLSAPNFYDNDPVLSREGIAVPLKGESSMIAADAAIEFISKHKDSSSPFFAFVCFGSPHNPYVADEQDKALYGEEEDNLQNYYGEITGIDRAVGKIHQEIRNMGIAENTIVWFLSDNGGVSSVSVTGGREGKGSIYEGGLRVPAIFEWPAMVKKQVITAIPCNTSDIYPTLLQIAGIDIGRIANQHELDGISLVPLIEGDMKSRPKLMGFWQHQPAIGLRTPTADLMPALLESQQAGIMKVDDDELMLDAWNINEIYPQDTFPGHAAWLDWPYKLHRIQDPETGEIVYELYDLLQDPMEEKNIYASESEKAEQMEAALDRWLESVVNSMNGKDYVEDRYTFIK